MFSATRIALTPKSLTARLTLWYLLMLSGALAAFAVFVFVTRSRAIRRELDVDLEIRSQRLVAGLQAPLLELDVPSALADQRPLATVPMAVRDTFGTPLYRSPAFPELAVSSERAAARAARDGVALATVEDRAGREYRVATVVTTRPGAGSLAVQLVLSTEAVQASQRQLALAMLLSFLLIVWIASYGGRFIARRALAPVDRIVERVRAIQATRLGERLDLATGSAELDRLADTLNGMLDRLEASMLGARRFAADASHELQTPIAAMRTAIDVCLTDTGSTLEEYRATAEDLVEDLERLSRLIRDLRLLALADAGHLLDTIESVDVTTVVRDACEIVQGAAEPKAITVSVDVLTDVIVRGSTLHLRRALLNLLQNAVRYSPDGSTIQITAGRLDQDAVVVIVDEGCGIPQEDLAHVFERFYRADPARARETGGTGLGLPIADQIVRIHGGRIDVTSEVGRGSTFAVFLPLASASDRPPHSDAAQAAVNVR